MFSQIYQEQQRRLVRKFILRRDVRHDGLNRTDVQRDRLACQRAHKAIDAVNADERSRYHRLQELTCVVDQLLPRLDQTQELRIHLNPMRAWATLETNHLVDERLDPPINVLFFQSRGEIASVVLELEGQALLNELVDYQPCTLAEWASVSSWATREELVEFCRDLAEIGLIAIG